MNRLRTGTVTVDVDVDISDVIDQIDDQELLDEVNERGLKAPQPATSALMAAIEAEHRDRHPWGPLWAVPRRHLCPHRTPPDRHDRAMTDRVKLCSWCFHAEHGAVCPRHVNDHKPDLKRPCPCARHKEKS